MKVNMVAQGSSKWHICPQDHPYYQCPDMKQRNNVSNRVKLAQQHRLRFNCLEPNHSQRECKSKGLCRKCGKRHHTLLYMEHSERESSAPPAKVPASTQPSSSGDVATGSGSQSSVADQPVKKSYHIKSQKGVVRMTAIVNIPDSRGTLQQCRVILLDTGSEADLIVESAAQRLGLAREQKRVRITGTGDGTASRLRGPVKATLISRYDSQCTLDVNLHDLPSLTGMLPSAKCQGYDWEHLRGLEFGDPRWFQPRRVDMVIGIKKFNHVMQAGRGISQDPDAPVAWESIFGWLVSGSCPLSRQPNLRSYYITVDPVLDIVCELEEIPEERQLSKEEEECDSYFQRTHQRMPDGRYVLQVPFNRKA